LRTLALRICKLECGRAMIIPVSPANHPLVSCPERYTGFHPGNSNRAVMAHPPLGDKVTL